MSNNYKGFNNNDSFDSALIKPKSSKIKKLWIITGVIVVISVIVITSVTTYVLLSNKKDNQNEDPETTTETTTTTKSNDEPKRTTPTLPPLWTTIPYPSIPTYLSLRDIWGAENPKTNQIPKLDLPIKRIILAHTGGNSCSEEADCIATVKSLQFHDPTLDDIPYNFLIGGDGKIYEGRGFHYQGQHTQNKDATEYNSIGICIAFIGNYESIRPNSHQIEFLNDFIEFFIKHDLIAEDYIIVSQDDLKYFKNKAIALNEVSATFKNFRSLYKIYRREEWAAKDSQEVSSKYSRIMDWVLIGHSVTPLCNDLNACMIKARSLQTYSFDQEWKDILYNIFFGGDGYAFEGRGWDYIASHAKGMNDKSIGVGVIGDFDSIPPNNAILEAMLRVFDDAMALGKLTDDSKIFGRADFGGPGPGYAFMQIIRGWCRYGNRTDACNPLETTTSTTTIRTEVPVTTTQEQTTTTLQTISYPDFVSTRADWEAESPKSNEISKLELPIKRIIVGHTNSEICTNEADCISAVKSLQFHDSTLDDIPYNFLIGGDGKIYEGRGFHYQGQHTKNLDATEYDSIGICIAFIGNYGNTPPNSSQMEVLKKFIEAFVDLAIISKDHIIVLQDDLKYFPTKATALNAAIENFDNFYPLYKIHRREEWNAQRNKGAATKYNKTMNWVLIGHTDTPLCTNLSSCSQRARSLQSYSFDQNWNDILYNIFFGGDGYAFEGRGWDYIATHAKGMNDISIGAGVIGNFESIPPNNAILEAMIRVFDDAMALGKLTDDSKIFGRADFGGPGPGKAFMEIIRGWNRYGNKTDEF